MRATLALFVLILLLPTALFSQVKTGVVYRSHSNGRLCSSSVLFYNDSTFAKESGCEASSSISYGKWTIHKDTVILSPFNNKTETFISSFTATQVATDSVYVTILDKNGNNITSEISMGIYVPKLGTYPFKLNADSTQKVAYRRPGGTLWLRRLAHNFKRNFEYETATANNFVIKLNVPFELFEYPEAEWQNSPLQNLIYKEGALVDPNAPPDFPIIYSVE